MRKLRASPFTPLSTQEDAGDKTRCGQRSWKFLRSAAVGSPCSRVTCVALDKSLERLRELIRNRYLIAYKAADFQPNGKYRTIHITAEKDGQQMQVHARKGYYARVEAPPTTKRLWTPARLSRARLT